LAAVERLQPAQTPRCECLAIDGIHSEHCPARIPDEADPPAQTPDRPTLECCCGCGKRVGHSRVAQEGMPIGGPCGFVHAPKVTAPKLPGHLTCEDVGCECVTHTWNGLTCSACGVTWEQTGARQQCGAAKTPTTEGR
jgi:hypothetical protein